MSKIKCIFLVGTLLFFVLFISAIKHIAAINLVSSSAGLTVAGGLCLSAVVLGWKRVVSVIQGKNKGDVKLVVFSQIGIMICSTALGFIAAMLNFNTDAFAPASATAALPLLYCSTVCTYLWLANTEISAK
jgi:hypothetical protein